MAILCGVRAYHVASGGVAGSEGSVHLTLEGDRDKVEAAIFKGTGSTTTPQIRKGGIFMFNKPDSTGYKQAAEGVQLKVLVYGDKMLMAEFKLSAGSVVPEHDHPHEQAGYVVSGRIRMNVKGKQPFETGPGGAWSIPGDIPHSAEVLEDAVVVEVFHPVREDFLDK